MSLETDKADYLKAIERRKKQNRDRLAQARKSPHEEGETPEPAQRGTKRIDSLPVETHMT